MKERTVESAFKTDSVNQILTDLLTEWVCAFLTPFTAAAVLCCVWIIHCTAGRCKGDGQVSQPSIDSALYFVPFRSPEKVLLCSPIFYYKLVPESSVSCA